MGKEDRRNLELRHILLFSVSPYFIYMDAKNLCGSQILMVYLLLNIEGITPLKAREVARGYLSNKYTPFFILLFCMVFNYLSNLTFGRSNNICFHHECCAYSSYSLRPETPTRNP